MSEPGLGLRWGVGESGPSRHAFAPQGGFARRTFKPRSLCGLAWSPTADPVDEPERRSCATCVRLTDWYTADLAAHDVARWAEEDGG